MADENGNPGEPPAGVLLNTDIPQLAQLLADKLEDSPPKSTAGGIMNGIGAIATALAAFLAAGFTGYSLFALDIPKADRDAEYNEQVAFETYVKRGYSRGSKYQRDDVGTIGMRLKLTNTRKAPVEIRGFRITAERSPLPEDLRSTPPRQGKDTEGSSDASQEFKETDKQEPKYGELAVLFVPGIGQEPELRRENGRKLIYEVESRNKLFRGGESKGIDVELLVLHPGNPELVHIEIDLIDKDSKSIHTTVDNILVSGTAPIEQTKYEAIREQNYTVMVPYDEESGPSYTVMVPEFDRNRPPESKTKE